MSAVDLNERKQRGDKINIDAESVPMSPPRITRMSDAFNAAGRMISKGPQPNPLRTGFDELDAGLKRLGPKEFTMLAADSGIGKSTIATQAALHVGACGHGVVYLNLEMSEEMYGLRTAANFVQLATQKAAAHQLSPDEHSMLAQGFSTLFGPAKRIALGNRKEHRAIPAIKKFCEEAARQLAAEGSPVKLIVVDHVLQVLVNAKNDKDAEGKARTELLKDLSESLECHVLALVHITRDGSKGGTMPTKNQLASSAWFDRDPDNILVFHQKRNQADGTFVKDLPATLSCQKARWGEPFAVELEYRKGFFYPWSLEPRADAARSLAQRPPGPSPMPAPGSDDDDRPLFNTEGM
jgi:replicative DNA helicase